MHINFKKLTPDAITPTFGNDKAAGIDLYTSQEITIKPQEISLIPTGISVELPDNHVGLLALRSSAPKKHGIFCPHGMGVIDCDYRGEYLIQVIGIKDTITIPKGTKIAQVVIVPARAIASSQVMANITGITENAELSDTHRGEGGFGSTGS